MYLLAITSRHIDGSVGVLHSAVCGSNRHQEVLLKGWSGFFKGLMHVLCTAAIPYEADILQE